jgi:hypothetical protein
MKEEPEKQNVVEEPQLQRIPGYEETATAETAVVETPAAEEPKYKYTAGWWQMPNYVEAEKKYQEAGKKQMEIAEKRAKRQRDLAIFGDLAKLGAQAYAKNGGVYKIDKFTPQTEIANEKLRKVRDNNAAQIMAYADRMRTAQQGDAANEQARMKAEYDYSIADAAAKAKAAKDERDYLYKVAKDAVDADLKERQLALQEDRLAETKTHNKKSLALGYARLANDGKDGKRDWISEYWKHIPNYPEFAIYLTDEDGVPITDGGKPVFNPYITEKQAESVVKRITEFATARNKARDDKYRKFKVK